MDGPEFGKTHDSHFFLRPFIYFASPQSHGSFNIVSTNTIYFTYSIQEDRHPLVRWRQRYQTPTSILQLLLNFTQATPLQSHAPAHPPPTRLFNTPGISISPIFSYSLQNPHYRPSSRQNGGLHSSISLNLALLDCSASTNDNKTALPIISYPTNFQLTRFQTSRTPETLEIKYLRFTPALLHVPQFSFASSLPLTPGSIGPSGHQSHPQPHPAETSQVNLAPPV